MFLQAGFGFTIPAWATILSTLAVLLGVAYAYGKYREATQNTHNNLEGEITEIQSSVEDIRRELHQERKSREREHEVVITWLSNIHEEVAGDIDKPDEVTEVVDIEDD